MGFAKLAFHGFGLAAFFVGYYAGNFDSVREHCKFDVEQADGDKWTVLRQDSNTWVFTRKHREARTP